MPDVNDEYEQFKKDEEARRAESDTAVTPDGNVEVPLDADGVARGDSGGRDVTDPSTAPGVVVETPFDGEDE